MRTFQDLLTRPLYGISKPIGFIPCTKEYNSAMDLIGKHAIEIVFVLTLITYAVLIGKVSNDTAQSKDSRVAHENFPKAVKHITSGFVTIVIFLLLYYLATTGVLPKEVLITLVSVFATAGFLTFRAKE